MKLIEVNDEPIVLQSDIAGEFPVYVYIDSEGKKLLYSEDIVDLLEDQRVKKPLSVSNEGLSFLIQTGLIPLPNTIYENVFTLGIGHILEVNTVNNKLNLTFKYEFPFYNKNRYQKEEMQPNDDMILELITNSVVSRVDKSKNSFLFHSAGKDSNTIALALAEAGLQNEFTLVTHKSKGASDESEISKSIASKLGFKHHVLKEIDKLQGLEEKVINDFFNKMPFPCTDNVTLAYPFHSIQLPELIDSNIIDGGGNDSYMMTPFKKRESRVLPVSRAMQHFQKVREFINSESYISPFFRTPPEWFGMNGLNYGDARMLFPSVDNVYGYWCNEASQRNKLDSIDFKTDLYTLTISELHIRKARNFADVIGSNLVLPFANKEIADYFRTMPEDYLFNRKTLDNKLVLRELLYKRIGLDSNKIGKMPFTYDSHSLISDNWKLISSEILSCSAWDKQGVFELIKRMEKSMKGKGWSAGSSGRLLYRLYLISGWLNNSKWLN